METAGGVAAAETGNGPNQTLPIRRDTTGRPHLPGTSVAGNLRAYCATDPALAADEQRGRLFGSNPGDQGRTASPIQVLGTIWRGAGEVQRRTRTAINRERGAADTYTLHTIEQLPAGTQFDVHLRWDDPDDRLSTVLDRLRRWRPQLGRGVSSGAGQCRVAGFGYQVYDLGTTEGLHAWLQLASPADYPAPEPVADDDRPEALLDVDLAIVDALHVGTGTLAEDALGTYGAMVRDDAGTPIVPGSSLKGVLRSRSAYICRVLGVELCADERCGECVPCRLFGYTGKNRTAQRSKIAVHDAAVTDAVVEQRQHVAIDRVTGGAATALLYADEVITAGRFTLRIDALEPNIAEHERLLLKAALADLDAGLIGIGARTTAGQGTVRIVAERSQPAEPISRLATHLTREAA
nr:RAMP superfamily CRISPR-associated protein [Saccharopolyspora sp. HNM0983]